MQGCELTGCLTSKGLPVVAISSEDSLNNMMITTGAIFGIRKDKLWFELHQGKIKLPELVENARSCQFG